MRRIKLVAFLIAAGTTTAFSATAPKSLDCMRTDEIIGTFDSIPVDPNDSVADADARTIIHLTESTIPRLLFWGPSFGDDSPASYIFAKGQPLRRRILNNSEILYSANRLTDGLESTYATLSLHRVQPTKVSDYPSIMSGGTPIFGIVTWEGSFERTRVSDKGYMIDIARISLACRESPEWPKIGK